MYLEIQIAAGLHDEPTKPRLALICPTMLIVFALLSSSLLAAGWVLPTPRASTTTAIRASTTNVRATRLALKKAPDAAPEERPEVQISTNSIVEFNDAKHGSGQQPAVLGLVKGVRRANAPPQLCPDTLPPCLLALKTDRLYPTG